MIVLRQAQKELKTVLPARPEYVVDTSEFQQVKSRLASIENRHKLQNDKDTKDRPTLRRATADNPSGGSGSDSGPAAPRRMTTAQPSSVTTVRVRASRKRKTNLCNEGGSR